MTKAKGAGPEGPAAAKRAKATPGGVADAAGYPAGNAGEVLQVFDFVARPILRDRRVWAEEAARTDCAALPWPLADGEGYVQLLRVLATQLVEDVLEAMRAKGTAPDPNPASAGFQLVLRVVSRAIEAGDSALVKRFGGSGRLSLRRDLENFAKKLIAEDAVRSGLPRAQAFKKAGIGKHAAYRALKRKPSSR